MKYPGNILRFLPPTHRGSSWHLIHTVQSDEANSFWMATTFSITVLSAEQLSLSDIGKQRVKKRKLQFYVYVFFLLCLLFYCHIPLLLEIKKLTTHSKYEEKSMKQFFLSNIASLKARIASSHC